MNLDIIYHFEVLTSVVHLNIQGPGVPRNFILDAAKKVGTCPMLIAHLCFSLLKQFSLTIKN